MDSVMVSFNTSDIASGIETEDDEDILVELFQHNDMPGTIILTDYWGVFDLYRKLGKVLNMCNVE